MRPGTVATIVLVIGVLMAVDGLLVVPGGPDTELAGWGIIVTVFGIILEIRARPAAGKPSHDIGPLPAAYGGLPPLPPSPLPSQIACRSCGRVYLVGQYPFCPNCGQKLG